jgi:PAS domain S-box-containing protein
MKRSSSGSGIGLRREVLIVLPVVFLLLVLLSTYTLFSYRNGIRLMVEARRVEATRLAGKLAESVAEGHISTASELRQQLPQAEHLLVVSADGRPTLESGPITTGTPFSDFGGADIDGPVAIGPDKNRDYVAAIAPTVWNRERQYLRIELQAHELHRQLTNVRTLAWVILPMNAALSALVLLFMQHLLAPYDKLLAAARRMQTEKDTPEDEVAFLISSFERGIRALEAERSPERDLETLELALGPSLESGFLLLGHGGEVLFLNPVGAQILGSPPPDPGTSVEELLASQAELSDLVTTAVKSNEPIHRQEVEIGHNGDSMTLGLSVHPLRRDDGEVRGFLALFADLTETHRQAQEERLSFSLAQVGELAAGVAHEMRNSLSTFRGYLTLVERAPEEEAITDYLSELRRETDHLQRVLEDFLSFARPESTRPELLNLEAVVHRAAVDPALEGGKVEIQGREQLPVMGDSQLLERAIRNLLHNACQAQQAAGIEEPVTVRTSRRQERALVQILDRGHGLPQDVRDRLFEPFVTGRPGGVGLGLSLARRIVDLHGGQLQLSDRPSGGTLAELSISLVDN